MHLYSFIFSRINIVQHSFNILNRMILLKDKIELFFLSKLYFNENYIDIFIDYIKTFTYFY